MYIYCTISFSWEGGWVFKGVLPHLSGVPVGLPVHVAFERKTGQLAQHGPNGEGTGRLLETSRENDIEPRNPPKLLAVDVLLLHFVCFVAHVSPRA